MKNALQVDNLIKTYPGVLAVSNLSFSVNAGEFFALLGANGAGKTTTINILSGLLAKNSGRVMVAGIDADSNANAISQKIGVVFQNSVLDETLTVYENLFFRGSLYHLSLIELKNRIDDISELLELKKFLKRKIKTLSGGQKRRVDIARALINRPEILFLDEPTTGLDPQSRAMVWEIILRLRSESAMTVLLTTHYMEETEHCDHVLILDEGKIAAEGTPHDLKNRYTGNYILIYTPLNSEIEIALTSANLQYEYRTDCYRAAFNDAHEVTNFIVKNQSWLNDYEVIRGNMDDVFLAVTGKKLEE